MKFRDTPQGARQREVLRALEKDAGRKRAFIVADLTTDIEVGHDQYRRYLRGDTPLKWSHFSAFAKAFKVTTSELTRALGLMDDEVDPGLMDRVLDALRPLGVPDSTAVYAAKQLTGVSKDAQNAVLREIEELSRE